MRLPFRTMVLALALMSASVAAQLVGPPPEPKKEAPAKKPPPPKKEAPAKKEAPVAKKEEPSAPATSEPATPAPSTAPEASAPPPAPSSPPASTAAPVAPTSPPIVEPTPSPPPSSATPSGVTPVPEAQSGPTLDSVLSDLTPSEIALLLFAAAITLFTISLWFSTAGLSRATRRQLEESRKAIDAGDKAADAARRSAEAAEHMVSTMRDTADRQLRAYVTVKQFLQAPVKDDRQNAHGWLLQVVWQNTGTTPTKGFRYWAMLREFEKAIPEDFEFTPKGLKDFAGGELGSYSSVNSPPLFLNQQLITALQDGSRKALLLGQADYSDVLAGGGKHETRFCVELVLVNDPSGANGSPFSFSYHPQHNTMS